MNVFRTMLEDIEKRKKEREEEKEYERLHNPRRELTWEEKEAIAKKNQTQVTPKKKSFWKELKGTTGCFFQAIVVLICIIVGFCILGFTMNYFFKGCDSVDVDHIHYERY